jgi:hypothetical protein
VTTQPYPTAAGYPAGTRLAIPAMATAQMKLKYAYLLMERIVLKLLYFKKKYSKVKKNK